MPPPAIPPTVGRGVWYYPGPHDLTTGRPGPFAAVLVHVWNDRMVNLTVFRADGVNVPRTSAELAQPGDPLPEGRSYCRWMDFQVGQAQKTAELEAKLAAAGGP